VVWHLRLIGDTEGPALITSTAWHCSILLFCLLGTPTTILTQGGILILVRFTLKECLATTLKYKYGSALSYN